MLLPHAGDSITIAPAQTLTDKEYQRLRDASIAIIRDMGVECGGSNVQMAVNPDDGQARVQTLATSACPAHARAARSGLIMTKSSSVQGCAGHQQRS